MIRPGIGIGRARRAGVVDFHRELADFPLIAVFPHMVSVLSACGLKTSPSYNHNAAERGSWQRVKTVSAL